MHPSTWWKTMIVGAGLVASVVGSGTWASASPEVDEGIAAHRQAATEARQKVAFHERMAAQYKVAHGNSKMDLVGHCQSWADYYRRVVTKEEQAAKTLGPPDGTR